MIIGLLARPFPRKMDIAKTFEELLVVVVIYGRQPEESQAITSLDAVFAGFSSRPEIFVYDNSPTAGHADSWVTYVHDPSNGGVSKAYNQAAAFAFARNKKWMLLLDQDTTVAGGLFEAWRAAILQHRESVAFVPVMKDAHGTVSPFALSMGGGRRTNAMRDTFPLSAYRFINSGLFIHCEAFAAVGGYDERLPLDFSDVSFGHQLMQITDHFVVIDSKLEHSLSSTTQPPLREAVRRFGYFCRGARSAGLQSGAPYRYLVRALLRALHLAVRYRKMTFIRIFLNTVNG